jgi:hypothetical protein
MPSGSAWLCGLIDALYFQAADPAFDPVRDTEMMLLIVRRALQPAAGRRSGAAKRGRGAVAAGEAIEFIEQRKTGLFQASF